jgi:polysaccharide export outer membrane protein
LISRRAFIIRAFEQVETMSIALNRRHRRQLQELRRDLTLGRPDPHWWEITQRLLAALLMVACGPLLMLLYPLVRLTSPGPFLFKQERPGKDGAPFMALKIRTMREGADLDISLARSVRGDNPLVTPIGRTLRELKLDELPQLWNVLRGDMALVGPRPLGLTFQQELERTIPGFSERLRVRPGLTSLAQVAVLESADKHKVIADWKRRFQAERHYLMNRSPLYDLIVIGLTAAYILRKILTKLSRIGRPRVVVSACLVLILASACSPALNPSGLVNDTDLLRKEILLTDAGRSRSPIKRQMVELPTSISSDSVDRHYRIGVGDKLLINVFGEPGLTNLLVRVDAGGRIQMPIVELFNVEGKTTAEVQAQLKRAFSEQFNDPWVVVNLTEFRSRPLYLIGEFNKPGVIYLETPTNLVQALGLGSGITPDAHLRGARLLRENKIVPVDVYALLREGRFDQNVWLEAGDTIYVPGREDPKVFVLGAVVQPGAMPHGDAGLGLLEAMVNAQGPRMGAARLQDVRIIRSHSPTRGELLVVDLERILVGESPDLPLQPGDIVYVPQTPLADWNDVIAQIAPTLALISGTLEPFVQIKFLSDS